MYDWMLGLFSKWIGLDLAVIVTTLVFVNAFISGLQMFIDQVQKALESFKDKTDSKVDDNIYILLGKVSGFGAKALGWISKALDILSANKKH